jgi:two-component system, NtrC family, nitrogen regulation sensor histidine kinase NtrY
MADPRSALRPPRRFRRRVLAVLLAAGLGPLVIWGLAARSLVGGALSVAPPIEPLLGRAAEVIERSGDAPLVAELRQAELHLAQAEVARRRLLATVPGSFLLALAASALLLGGAAWLLGRRLSRPVEALADGMARYARGELEHEVTVPGGPGDEFDFLAGQLNQMGRELQSQRDRLQVTEKLAAWRDVARAMAHDLKNPLTAMRMALARLTRPGRSDEATTDAVSLLQQELEVLIRMTQSFSDFARLPDPVRRPLDLAALLEEVAALYREQAPAGVEVRADARPTISGDADQLRRAFGNLVKNALEATREGAVEILLAAPGPALVRVVVRDPGVGIPAALEGGELVEGLASTKAAGRSGLGLPIAQKIVHDHGGRLRLVPRAPRGTEAIVDLPESS